jgi:hypothetical protein
LALSNPIMLRSGRVTIARCSNNSRAGSDNGCLLTHASEHASAGKGIRQFHPLQLLGSRGPLGAEKGNDADTVGYQPAWRSLGVI